MFTRAKCSVDNEEKEWIEKYMLWLMKEFGDCKSIRVVLPTKEFFPDPYVGDEESAVQVVKRVCSYMRVDYSRLDIAFFEEEYKRSDSVSIFGESYEKEGAAGLYIDQGDHKKFILAIDRSQVDNPPILVATTAHELGHVHLLGDKRIPEDEENPEHLTDLLTVFLGMGVFTANAAFQFSQWDSGMMSGWNASRQGYLTEKMYGYSLAVFAWIRGELKPKWAKNLSPNNYTYFKQNMKYLLNTGDIGLTKG